MSDKIETNPDQKLIAQLAAQIASLNPCCTTAEIMEMAAEEFKNRTSADSVEVTDD